MHKLFASLIAILLVGSGVWACYNSRAVAVRSCSPRVVIQAPAKVEVMPVPQKVQVQAPVVVPQVQQQIVTVPQPVVVQQPVVTTVQTVAVPQAFSFVAVPQPVVAVQPILLRRLLFPRLFHYSSYHNSLGASVY